MIVKRGKKYGARIYSPTAGQNIWLGTFDTKREALQAELDALTNTARHRKDITVGEFAETWVDRFPRPKETTNRVYREQIRRFAKTYGNMRLSEFNRKQARDWALEHRSQVKIVRAMFNDAIRDEAVDRNPFEDLRLPQPRGNKDLIVPTDEEVDRLIAAASLVLGDYGRLVYGNMIRFAAYSGLRLGELVGLGWDDVDLSAGTITVRRQWSTRLGEFTSPKSDKTRTVILTRQARQAFEATPQQHEELFRSPAGARFSGGLPYHYWGPVRTAAGLPGFPWHGLRHFFGTYLARHGVGPVQIQLMMGHADIKTTMVYVHMTERDSLAMVALALGEGGPRGVVVPVEERKAL